jgi:quercetin dioxygenase-like cupin family protein
MKIFNLKDMHRGWFIGDFEPSVLKTKDFEIGILTHKKDETWPKHYHKIATEYNVLLKGKIKFNNTIIDCGDIFIFEPNEVSIPIFLEDCQILCVKTPSVIGDKYIL